MLFASRPWLHGVTVLTQTSGFTSQIELGYIITTATTMSTSVATVISGIYSYFF
jgi:hypothetical protein